MDEPKVSAQTLAEMEAGRARLTERALHQAVPEQPAGAPASEPSPEDVVFIDSRVSPPADEPHPTVELSEPHAAPPPELAAVGRRRKKAPVAAPVAPAEPVPVPEPSDATDTIDATDVTDLLDG